MRLVILSPVLSEARILPVGSEVDLPADAAEALIAAGAAEAAAPAAPVRKAKAAPVAAEAE
jgi:hypothetical protein